MAVRKRKQACYTELASFPDDMPREKEKKNLHAPMDAASVSDAWLHCGDGFQIASSLEAKGSLGKPVSAEKSFASLLSSAEGISKTDNLCEFTNIVWSSSGSEFSDDENNVAALDFPCTKMKTYRKYALISKEAFNKEPQFIEWENDSDYEDDEQCSGLEDNDVPFDILDTDSCTNSIFKPDGEKKDQPSKKISPEISEFSSDDENLEESNVEMKATHLEFPKKFQFCSRVGFETDTGKSATDWLKSAQTLLQTPKKKIEKSFKTPEDSTKKRKLLRGGLAERLNRLQNRKRSAVNFWRHQCTSDYETLSGGKLGILIVKILEIHEECTLCVAICHQLGQICADDSITKEIVEIQSKLKVLFAKETTAHLKAVPQDIICIHPPWQKLYLQNENVPVILNTYFSQKVILKESTNRSTDMGRPHLQEPLLAKRNVSLAGIFNLSDIKDNWSPIPAVNQVSCSNMKTSKNTKSCFNIESDVSNAISLSDSLLEVVEMQGTAEGTVIQAQVVIQRVYYLVAEDGFRCCPHGNNPPQNVAPSDLQNLKLCLMVQDIYGIFSEIQLPVLFPSSQVIEQYSKKWEGKYCHVSGLKILRRVTRGRTLELFSLIDSLWPPLSPVQVPGKRQVNEMQVTANQFPPSFCYILAAQSDYIDTDEREPVSNLYVPPAVHSLKEIYQMGDLPQRCSFWAYVVYRRQQGIGSTSPDQRQFWLFVTDFSLQRESEISCRIPKTISVSVASSCVIDVEVMEALNNTSHCVVFFKDAMCGNGKIICIERTILLLQKPLLCRAAGTDITELTGPVKLDDLDSTTQINSICTIRGTVVGINEKTAFSWPTCNRCGNGKVEQHQQDKGLFYCSHCCEAVTSPVFKMDLEVFLSCQSQPKSIIKVKLLQKSVSSLLESSPMDDESYEVTSMLRKEVGFLNCYVQSITSHPSSCIRLEEIVLPIS